MSTGLAPSEESILFGVPLGPVGPPTVIPRTRQTPVSALEFVVGSLLDDSPCYVAFSGGCDSSLVLAAAVAICRRLGHVDPIPITYRYRESPATDEHEYQEAVVGTLKLRHWVVLELDDTDLIGPATTPLLMAYGSLWPAPAFATAAHLSDLEPGLFLTGEGGDDVLGPRRFSSSSDVARYLLRGHRLPPWALSRLAVRSLVPASLRTRRTRDAIDAAYAPDWLRPGVRRYLIEKAANLDGGEPLAPSRWLSYHLSLPWVWIAARNLRALHAELGFRWEAPLLAPGFLGALESSTRWWEYRGRAALLRRHFSELIPSKIIERRTKASFGGVLFGQHTRAFAESWDGRGVPEGVDAARLRASWLSDEPHLGTAMLLHRAWLTTRDA